VALKLGTHIVARTPARVALLAGASVVLVSWLAWVVIAIGANPEGEPGVTHSGNREFTDGVPSGLAGPLQVCFSAHPKLSTSQFQSALLAELGTLKASDEQAWRSVSLGQEAPEVVEGCPGGFVEPPAGIKESGKEVLTGIAKQPSRFPLHIYVLPDEEAQPLLAGRSHLRAAFELGCSGGACGEVTTAIYISAASASGADAATLRRAYAEVLGIVPLNEQIGSQYPLGHPEGETSTK
jgi:hypothetical protein